MQTQTRQQTKATLRRPRLPSTKSPAGIEPTLPRQVRDGGMQAEGDEKQEDGFFWEEIWVKGGIGTPGLFFLGGGS